MSSRLLWFPADKNRYPKCAVLGLLEVPGAPGFDSEDVAKAIGPEKYQEFEKFLADNNLSDFVCGHRKHDSGHEVHCVYAVDLEKFLA